MLCANGQLIIQEREDELQRSIYKLYEVCDVNISKSKTKVVAFKGRESVRSKIDISNQISKQVLTELKTFS